MRNLRWFFSDTNSSGGKRNPSTVVFPKGVYPVIIWLILQMLSPLRQRRNVDEIRLCHSKHCITVAPIYKSGLARAFKYSGIHGLFSFRYTVLWCYKIWVLSILFFSKFLVWYLSACLRKNRPVILDRKVYFPYILGYQSLYLSNYKRAFCLTENAKYIFLRIFEFPAIAPTPQPLKLQKSPTLAALQKTNTRLKKADFLFNIEIHHSRFPSHITAPNSGP